MVARKLQASCKPVVSLFEASFSPLFPGSRAEHGCGPTAQQGHVPKRPVLRYRLGKSRRRYMNSTRFEPAALSGLKSARRRAKNSVGTPIYEMPCLFQ